MGFNKYANIRPPEPRVIKPAPAMDRKRKREIFFGWCPCGSGKKWKNCCFIKERRKNEVAK